MAMFEFRKHLLGAKNLVTLPFIIANTQTVYNNSMVYLDSDGFVIPCSAGSLIAGVVMGIVSEDGLPLETNTDLYDGTFTARSGSTPAKYVSEADNETVMKVKVLVAVDPYALYKNDADADIDQGDVFAFGNLVSSIQVDGSDVGAAAYGGVQCMALDPDNESDDSMGLFRIAESQLSPWVQQ